MAMISTDIRGDLVSPTRYFKKLEVIHFYHRAPYFDFNPNEFKNLVHYSNFFDLCHKLKKYKPDIIQGSEPYGFPLTFQACTASFFMSKLLNVPLFFPMLERRPPEARFGFLSPLLKKYLKIYAKRANGVFYLSDGARRNLLDAGVYENKLQRVMWGTWGVDIDKFTPKRNGLEPNFGRAILFVGRLEEHKGIQYLLPAFKGVKKAIEYVKLVIIGDGSLRNKIKKYVRNNRLEKDVIFLGTVKNEDMPHHFRAVDLTVIPSITTKKFEEQVGMVNIQSMACGIPVVSTYCGGIPEFVKHGETGILVPERDVKNLVNVIIKLLKNDKLRKKLGKNARKYAVKNFDATKNIRINEKKVLDLLTKGGK
jgi:glycosyltransferase involved in cell wall biosynthesis